MTKLKTFIITAMCHDCKLSRDMTVNWHVAVYKILQKKIKNFTVWQCVNSNLTEMTKLNLFYIIGVLNWTNQQYGDQIKLNQKIWIPN